MCSHSVTCTCIILDSERLNMQIILRCNLLIPELSPCALVTSSPTCNRESFRQCTWGEPGNEGTCSAGWHLRNNGKCYFKLKI